MLYAVVMVVDMKVFKLSTCLTAFCTCNLMVDDTVDGKDNVAEKLKISKLAKSDVDCLLPFWS